ncbi:hypothetical protein [Chryseobacterium sp. HSC-36S06]|nr:hypothetical protein [Chryseobacterium sp. HSC-36S06]MCP2037402.1 hypothetical protein [Chryseobacterium sp. HSC-36S06]
MKKLDLNENYYYLLCKRNASAKVILQENGFEVYNGGGWTELQKKLK